LGDIVSQGLKSKLPGGADDGAKAQEDEDEEPAPAAKPKKDAKGGKKGKKGGKDMSSLFAALEEDADGKLAWGKGGTETKADRVGGITTASVR
jgi:hypothetical protein